MRMFKYSNDISHQRVEIKMQKRRTVVPRKFKYNDSGMKLTAGGLLVYDDEGVWLIEETTRTGTEWTDPGGKYRYEDCDIYVTISREFMEELFYSVSLTRENITSINETHQPIFVLGHNKQPVYQSYVVHADELERRYNVVINPESFFSYRKVALQTNPNVPLDYFPLSIRKVPYNEIFDAFNPKKSSIKLSFRVRKIIMLSHLRDKLIPPGTQNITSSIDKIVIT